MPIKREIFDDFFDGDIKPVIDEEIAQPKKFSLNKALFDDFFDVKEQQEITTQIETQKSSDPIETELTKEFDPESDEYDYMTARELGFGPDETGHWPSRDPNTGLLLKGSAHPTWSKTIEEEQKIGNQIIQKDGRYYSIGSEEKNQEFDPALLGKAILTGTADLVESSLRGLTVYTTPQPIMLSTGTKFSPQDFDPLFHKMAQSIHDIKDSSETWAQWKKEVEQASRGRMAGETKSLKGWGEALNTWSALVGQNLPLMGQTIIANAVGGIIGTAIAPGAGTEIGSHAAGIMSMALPEAGDYLENAISLGISAEDAEPYASLYGIGSGAIEYAQQLFMSGPFKRAYGKATGKIRNKMMAEAIKKAIKTPMGKIFTEVFGITIEGIEEIAQNGLQTFMTNRMIDELKKSDPQKYAYLQPQKYEGFGRAGITGAGVAAATRGLGKAVETVTDIGKAQVSDNQKTIIKEINNMESVIKDNPDLAGLYEERLNTLYKKIGGRDAEGLRDNEVELSEGVSEKRGKEGELPEESKGEGGEDIQRERGTRGSDREPARGERQEKIIPRAIETSAQFTELGIPQEVEISPEYQEKIKSELQNAAQILEEIQNDTTYKITSGQLKLLADPKKDIHEQRALALEELSKAKKILQEMDDEKRVAEIDDLLDQFNETETNQKLEEIKKRREVRKLQKERGRKELEEAGKITEQIQARAELEKSKSIWNDVKNKPSQELLDIADQNGLIYKGADEEMLHFDLPDNGTTFAVEKNINIFDFKKQLAKTYRNWDMNDRANEVLGGKETIQSREGDLIGIYDIEEKLPKETKNEFHEQSKEFLIQIDEIEKIENENDRIKAARELEIKINDFEKENKDWNFGVSHQRLNDIIEKTVQEKKVVSKEPMPKKQEIIKSEKEIEVSKNQPISFFDKNGAERTGIFVRSITKGKNKDGAVIEYQGKTLRLGPDKIKYEVPGGEKGRMLDDITDDELKTVLKNRPKFVDEIERNQLSPLHFAIVRDELKLNQSQGRLKFELLNRLRGLVEKPKSETDQGVELYQKQSPSMEFATQTWNRNAEDLLSKSIQDIQVNYLGEKTFLRIQNNRSGIESKVPGLGFYDPQKNQIYINRDRARKDTIFHEFAHPVMNYVKVNNPDLYNQGIELTIGTKYEEDAINEGYGEKAAEEGLIQAIGEKGAQIQDQAQRNKFKVWLRKMWIRFRNAYQGLFKIRPTFDQFVETFAYAMREPGLIQPQLTKEKIQFQKDPFYSKIMKRLEESGAKTKEELAKYLIDKEENPTDVARAYNEFEKISTEYGLTQKEISDSWKYGYEREFRFDPNSTQNEGRFRLAPPHSVDPEYFDKDAFTSGGKKTAFIRRKKFNDFEFLEGISAVVGKINGEEKIQALRFNKNILSETEAQKWWNANKNNFEFYSQKIPKIETGKPQEKVKSKPLSEVSKESQPGQFKRAYDGLVEIVAPASKSDLSKTGKNVLRKWLAAQAQKYNSYRNKLQSSHVTFTFMSREDALDFINRMENGKPQKTEKLQRFANSMREIFDKQRDRVRALGKGHLENFYENYFSHIWKDPKKARSVFGKRPLEGSKAFLKKRSIETVSDGIEAGLEPVSWNPVDLVLMKAFEMERYLTAQNIIQDLKSRGLIKFKYVKARMPEGYEKIDDYSFIRFLPPDAIKIKEAYDKLLVDQLMDIVYSLGVNAQRVMKIGRKKWGYAEGDKKIVTKFAGPESVLVHELGHILGTRYGLFEWITKPSGKIHEKGKYEGRENKADARRNKAKAQNELRALADLRYEGQKPDSAFKRYVRKSTEKEAVLLEALIHAPKKFKEIAPYLYERFTKFLNDHSELRPLLDIQPSLVMDTAEGSVSVPGVTMIGEYVAPADIARLLNNYLSPGLRSSKNEFVRGMYDGLRQSGNALNYVNLSLSAFHALNTTTDTIASTMGLGLRELTTKGQRLKGVEHIITAPISWIPNIWRGNKLKKEMEKDLSHIPDGEMKTMVKAIILAGGRSRMDTYYHNQAIKSLLKTINDVVYGTTKEKIAGIGMMPIRTAFSAVEVVSKPIMEYLVPRQKLGLFYIMAKHEIQRHRDGQITTEQLVERLSQSWDNVENRMGQLTYDNLFWNKTFKDMMMLTLRSVGWNLGSWREYGGVPVDIITTKKRLSEGDIALSQKMAYTIGAIATYTIMGATIGYLAGRPPEELKDYFFPKTGNKNPDGSDERLSLPTYAKDWWAYSTRPTTTLKHKLHPIWSMIADMLQNEDFYGTEIRHKDDPFMKQMLDVFEYAINQFKPFSVKNYERMVKSGDVPAGALAVSATGIISAPSYITRTEAQQQMYKYIIARLPRGARTKEKFEKNQLRKQLLEYARAGRKLELYDISKQFTEKELGRIYTEASKTPFAMSFKRLTAEEALHVYELATQQERDQVKGILIDKINKAIKLRKLSKDQISKYRELIKE